MAAESTLGTAAARRLGCQNGRSRGGGAQLCACKGVLSDALAPQHLDGKTRRVNSHAG